MDGITIVHKIWNGRANLADYKGDGPAGHVELLALRWFNPNTHEWNLDFATPNVGMLGIPGVGQFKNGRADFYDQEQINGRFVLVRFSIWATGEDSALSYRAPLRSSLKRTAFRLNQLARQFETDYPYA